MSNCITLANIDEALTCTDADNVAGVMQKAIIGYADDVTSWPTFPTPTSGSSMTLAEAGALVGDLTLAKDSTTCEITFTDETGEFSMTDQGDKGGENVLYQLDFERAKMTPEVFGFLNATRGRRLFAIVTDKNGTKYLMGDKINSAHRIAADAATTGAATTDVNKVPVRITYVCPRNLTFDGDLIIATE